MLFKVLSIDPSINKLGWSILTNREELIDCGILVYESTKSVSERIKLIIYEIAEIIQNYGINERDYLILESSAQAINPRSFLILERVRSAIETVAIINRIQVLGRVNPRAVHSRLLGLKRPERRPRVKEIIRDFIFKRFQEFFLVNKIKVCLQNQDLFDSILIGVYFCRVMSLVKCRHEAGKILSDI